MSKWIALILLSGLSLQGVTAAPLGADLQGLLNYAREHNPEFAASRFDADAAAQRMASSDALPDPVLRTELLDITNQGTNKAASLLPSQVGATRYLLMQSVPWFGRRGMQREMAEASVAGANGKILATWADLSSKIKSTYAQYYYLSGNDRLLRETLTLMNMLEQIAQTRYANGLGLQQDVIRAQIEQTELKTELLELSNMRHHLHGRLNALLSRPDMAELAQPAQPRKMPAAAKLDQALLTEKLRARNPQLQIADAQVEEAKKNRDLVYNNRYPGFTLGVAPVQSGSIVKSWDLMVEFNIPLQQDKRRSQEHEAEAMLAASDARKQALLNQMQVELSENVSGLDTARRTESLVAMSLLPQAQLTYQSAMAGYETGKVDFSTLLDAQRQILKARRKQLDLQLDEQLKLAEIERLLGEEL